MRLMASSVFWISCASHCGFVGAVNKGGVGNNKAVLQVLAKVGTLLKEDPGVGGNDKGNGENNPYPNTNWDNL